MFNFTIQSLNNIEVHEKAIFISKQLHLCEGKLIELLGWINTKKLFLNFNCFDIYNYSEKYLSLSRRKTFDLLQIYNATLVIPELKEEIKKEDFSYTKTRIALPALLKTVAITKPEIKNEKSKEIIAMTKNLSARELEKEVQSIAPQVTDTIKHYQAKWVGKNKLERKALLTEDEEALVSKAMNILSQKNGENISFEQFLVEVSNLVITKTNPIKKAETKASTHVCKTANSKDRYIPAKVKTEIIKRDESKCACCKKDKFLDFHHIKPLNQGGSNTVDNIITCCKSCHSLLHQGYLTINMINNKFVFNNKDPQIKTFTDYLFEQKRNNYLVEKQKTYRMPTPSTYQMELF